MQQYDPAYLTAAMTGIGQRVPGLMSHLCGVVHQLQLLAGFPRLKAAH